MSHTHTHMRMYLFVAAGELVSWLIKALRRTENVTCAAQWLGPAALSSEKSATICYSGLTKEMNIIQCVGFAFLLDPFHVVFWLTEKRSLKVTQPRWHRSGTIKSRENWEEANLNLFRTLVKESVRLSTFGWTRYLYLSEYLAVYHYFIYLNITTVYITYHSSSPNWAWPCSDAWDVCASFVCRRKGQAGTG